MLTVGVGVTDIVFSFEKEWLRDGDSDAVEEDEDDGVRADRDGVGDCDTVPLLTDVLTLRDGVTVGKCVGVLEKVGVPRETDFDGVGAVSDRVCDVADPLMDGVFALDVTDLLADNEGVYLDGVDVRLVCDFEGVRSPGIVTVPVRGNDPVITSVGDIVGLTVPGETDTLREMPKVGVGVPGVWLRDAVPLVPV